MSSPAKFTPTVGRHRYTERESKMEEEKHGDPSMSIEEAQRTFLLWKDLPSKFKGAEAKVEIRDENGNQFEATMMSFGPEDHSLMKNDGSRTHIDYRNDSETVYYRLISPPPARFGTSTYHGGKRSRRKQPQT